MSLPSERIPIPWPQRRELLRERLIPVACFAATVAACAWLWQQQASVAPVAVGEVYGDSVELTSPRTGELLAPSDDASDSWPLFAAVGRGDVVLRVRRADNAGEIVELVAPISGLITAALKRPGQFVQRGEPLLRISSPTPQYILCHLPYHSRQSPEVGAKVAIRQKGRGGSGWVASVVEAIGPTVEPAPSYQGADATVPTRGLPMRIALPPGWELKPGALVDVRFSPVRG